MKLHHIGIEVKDSYKMELFYRKYFQFKTVYRYVSVHQQGLRTVILEKDGFHIELMERPENEMNTKKAFHISLEAKDVRSEYSRLKSLEAAGIKEPRETGDGFLEMELKDPEGNIIEISRRIKPVPCCPIKAVIFDLDGTVIDSEGNYYEADKLMMTDYGVPFTKEMKNRYVGTGNLEMIKDIRKQYDIKDSVENMLNKKNDYYLQIARTNTHVFTEMKKFIELLKKAGYKLAIASGSSPRILDEIIALTGIQDYFSAVVSAETSARGKPAPDVFLDAARRLKIEPQYCAVVEDSQYGVEAAKRAFMPCIAIPYITQAPLADSFYMAELLFEKGISAFNTKKAFKWVRSF